jgi:hypothetical protein
VNARGAEPVVALLGRAHAAGVAVSRTGKGSLVLEVPPHAADLAAALRTRERAVLALFTWRSAVVAEQPAPCLLCARPALLRDPAERRPAHKVCVDALLQISAP